MSHEALKPHFVQLAARLWRHGFEVAKQFSERREQKADSSGLGRARAAGAREGKVLSQAANRRAVDTLKNVLRLSDGWRVWRLGWPV
jgi:hypothetical protein